MHILLRKSSLLSTSHALAWQTTSRSAGFVKSDRSQKVGGSFSKPIDIKKPSPYFTMPLASRFFFLSRSVRSKLSFPSGKPRIGYTLPHSCAHGFPRRCAGMGPSGGTTLGPYFSDKRARTYV